MTLNYDKIVNNPENKSLSEKEIKSFISANCNSGNIVGKFFVIGMMNNTKVCVVLDKEGRLGIVNDPAGQIYYDLILEKASIF